MESAGLFMGGWVAGCVVGGAAMWAIARTRIRALQEKGRWLELQSEEQKTFHERALAELQTAFRALSADALSRHSPEFLRLASTTLEKAHETVKGELSQRQEAIQGLVRPLEEQLKIYQARLQQQEAAQTQTQGEIRKQLDLLTRQNETLARETERFRAVLTSSQARGRWGEETLRRVVEAAGMSEHCDFNVQVQEGDLKPDMIVHLTEGRNIVVDAKTPELGFLSELDSADGAKRTEALKAHVGKLRQTIRDLSKKGYGEKFSGLGYVVLFLPAESLFSTALEGDPDLIVWAAEQRVILATPATLIALLRIVRVSWTQFMLVKNEQEIAKEAEVFVERVMTFYGHFEDVRKGLATAKDALDRADASYEQRVLPSRRRLKELGVVAE